LTTPLTTELWSAAKGVFEEILAHPFLTGLTTGTLERESFRLYVIQDVHYIAQFARILAGVAARAPQSADVAMLTARSADLAAEHALHQSLLADLGVTEQELEATPMAPANRAYTDYLHAVTHTRPFPDALAALVACPWIYWEVGKELIAQGSPDPLYQRWIQRYGGDLAAVNVPPFLALLDRVGEELTAAQRASAAEHFVLGCRYEWMFWDMGYHRQTWPV
jgi:thiaminase/transcriptional activator TenA